MKVDPPPPLPRQHSDGTRTWHSRDVAAQVRWMRYALAELASVSTSIVHRACSDSIGPSSAGGVAVSGGRYDEDGSVPGPVPAAVFGRYTAGRFVRGEWVPEAWAGDPVETAMQRFLGGLAGARAAMQQAAEAAELLAAISHEEANELLELVGRGGRQAGYCANKNCARWVAGTAVDRLRAGRCGACYTHRLRHAGEERPAELCAHDDEGVESDGVVLEAGLRAPTPGDG